MLSPSHSVFLCVSVVKIRVIANGIFTTETQRNTEWDGDLRVF